MIAITPQKSKGWNLRYVTQKKMKRETHLNQTTICLWIPAVYFSQVYFPEILTARPSKMMVGRWISFWEGLFSEAMLNFRSVSLSMNSSSKRDMFCSMGKKLDCFRGEWFLLEPLLN